MASITTGRAEWTNISRIERFRIMGSLLVISENQRSSQNVTASEPFKENDKYL
jgi:hypothetical protein